jgi:hypothetical protein
MKFDSFYVSLLSENTNRENELSKIFLLDCFNSAKKQNLSTPCPIFI